jgi:hypothetical protein
VGSFDPLRHLLALGLVSTVGERNALMFGVVPPGIKLVVGLAGVAVSSDCKGVGCVRSRLAGVVGLLDMTGLRPNASSTSLAQSKRAGSCSTVSNMV